VMSDYVVNIILILPFKKADLLNPKRDTHRRKLLPNVDLCRANITGYLVTNFMRLEL